MDKSWIHEPNRVSARYLQGVANFLDFALKSSENGKLACPCVKCVNGCRHTQDIVANHLLSHGISRSYTHWYFHGESNLTTGDSHSTRNGPNQVDTQHNVRQFIEDIVVGHTHNRKGFNPDVDDNLFEEHGREFNEEAKKFYEILKETDEELFDGCRKHSKLSFILDLFHKKCMNGWSNKSFQGLLNTLRETFPGGDKLPKSSYEVKKLIGELGLSYEKIHACPNNCMLFWKDNINDSMCSMCGASRWVDDGGDSNVGLSSKTKKIKRKAKKVLRWFPLKPRLQRLFMCSKTASLMRWHFDKRIDDGDLRHPADARAWKEFDVLHKDFSEDPRNVRLGLASDGFNPFRTLSVKHSTWPVVLTVYNFPPWLCMKQSSFILSLLIPGPDSPSDKIDVFLQPLIDEFNDLWVNGLGTYDAYSKSNFQMRVALMWTINDFPAYSMLSGWNTKKKFACPCCGFDTCSEWLYHGGKYCFLGHRRFMPLDHPYRRDRRNFNGSQEWREAPILPTGFDALGQLNGEIIVKDGKTIPMSEGWNKQTIFFSLPYWKTNLIRHNLDVMHVEKNVCDNILGTLLNIDGKSKDNLKSRLDLKKLGLRSDLHPVELSKEKFLLPAACYTMSPTEKEQMLGVLKGTKVPDSYSSNISRCVKLKQRKLIGLKSHDCHVLMQDLLPIAIREVLQDNVAHAITDLCAYFKEICSKVLKVSRLEKLEAQIGETLSTLEMIFPPSFFTVMVHLVVHLATEAKLAGPVHYRWMYPIERFLLTLKNYVKNRNYPEGSIAEGYIADECITHCSRYFEGVETRFNRIIRNDDGVELSPVQDAPLHIILGRPVGKVDDVIFYDKTLMQAHRYVLYNCDSVTPFIEEHREEIKRQQRSRNRKRSLNQVEIEKAHHSTFNDWFRSNIARLMEMKSPRVTDCIQWLARGPNNMGRKFKGYIIGGVRFHTKEIEERRKTQNSGVVITTKTSCLDDDVTYYGVLKDIIELNYFERFRVVLFKCDWIDPGQGKGIKKDPFGFTLVNLSKMVHTGVKSNDEPFVLASQVQQVFYVQDL
ncbi:hypothetical protein REPUB_Repub01dG0104600 [Reevesia pubescens]